MTSPARSIAAVFGLWALAVSQPLLDVLGRAPEFFVAHRADVIDAWILAVAVGAVGPLLIGGASALASLVRPRLGDHAVAAAVGLLGALFAVQAGYRLGVDGWSGALAALFFSALASAACWRSFAPFRTFLVVLSPAALIVPGLFVWNGPFHGRAAAGRAVSAAGETTVAVVVFDELSLVSLMDASGRINRARFPNIAALVDDGVWFRNATAVSDYTRWALPAILTGRYPAASTTPTPRDHPDTLFSLVARSHQVEVFEAVTAICPRDVCAGTGIPRGERLGAMSLDVAIVAAHVFLPPVARVGLPDLTENWANFDIDPGDDGEAERSVVADAGDGPLVIRATRNWRRVWRDAAGTDHLSRAEAFLDGISRDDRRPTLYFIHSLSTHHPARWMPSGQRIANRRAMPGLRGGAWTRDEWQVVQHQHAQLMQAGLADTLVGRLRERLMASGRYGETLVIVTADHGVSYRPGGRMRAFDGANAAELAPVPLIVKLPDGAPGPPEGTIDDRNAETIDILPTVADVLGVSVAWPIDGASLVAADVRRAQKRFFFNAATMHERLLTADLAARRDESVRRQSSLFGDGPWPAFTLPALAALVGRDVASFGVVDDEPAVRVLVDLPDAWRDVDRAAAELPAQLTGRLRVSGVWDFDRALLAVALNGRVVATTRAAATDGRWSAMLPPAALRPGANEVELFVVDPARPDRLRRPR